MRRAYKIGIALVLLLCVWGSIISANAATYWTAIHDQRANVCWMLFAICLLGVAMLSYELKNG